MLEHLISRAIRAGASEELAEAIRTRTPVPDAVEPTPRQEAAHARLIDESSTGDPEALARVTEEIAEDVNDPNVWVLPDDFPD